MHRFLSCPRCAAELWVVQDIVSCQMCGVRWSCREGFFDFVDGATPPYRGEVPQPEMRAILQDAERRGWQVAVQASDLLTPSCKSYIASFVRTGWWPSVGLGPNSAVLVVGCGWAAIADPLSRVCKEVVGIEPILERARFAALRKKQERLENLHVLRVDLFCAPLAEHYFDVVVLDGALEWLGEDAPRSPGSRQLEALVRIKKLLRPQGRICIGIENRYGIHYALGARDHNDLRLTSFMPRAAANLVTHGLKRRPYTTFTYSYWGYRELLERAGFAGVRIFASLPSHRMPRYLLPLDEDMAPLKYFVEKQFFPMADPGETDPRRRTRQVRWAQFLCWGARLLGSVPGLVRFFAPSFTISAMAGESCSSSSKIGL